MDYEEFNFRQHDYPFLNFSTEDYESYKELDIYESPMVRIISALFLFFMILFGIFGNLMLIHIIGLKWKIQTPFNLFIANLAIADILFTTARSLSLITHLFVGEFIFGNVGCKLISFFEYFGSVLSILTISVGLIALQFRIGIIVSMLIVIFLAVISSLPSVLEALVHQTFENHSTDKDPVTMCLKFYSSFSAQEGMQALDQIFYVKIPILVLIIYSALWIIEKVFVQFKILGGFVYDSLLIVMAVFFIILWSPALYLHPPVFEKYLKMELQDILLYMMHLLTGLTVIYKPFLYMCMHKGLKKEFHRYVQVGSDHAEGNHFV